MGAAHAVCKGDTEFVIVLTLFAVPRNDCCGWYGRHFLGCANASAQDRERAPNASRPQGAVNVVNGFEPILPHLVEVQPG
jgi:hypothetical protein